MGEDKATLRADGGGGGLWVISFYLCVHCHVGLRWAYVCIDIMMPYWRVCTLCACFSLYTLLLMQTHIYTDNVCLWLVYLWRCVKAWPKQIIGLSPHLPRSLERAAGGYAFPHTGVLSLRVYACGQDRVAGVDGELALTNGQWHLTTLLATLPPQAHLAFPAQCIYLRLKCNGL